MSNLSEIKSLARAVIKIACAGETLAGYKCEQRTGSGPGTGPANPTTRRITRMGV